MTIRARYASRCAVCRQSIVVGTEIEWARGVPARHPHCHQAGSATRAVAAPSTATAGPTTKQLSVLRRCRDRREWFDTFDGSGGYDCMRGPSDAQLAAMSRTEASALVGIIMDGGL